MIIPRDSILLSDQLIRSAGWSLRYVAYCEDAETPGLLGQIKGKTSHSQQTITISTVANPTEVDVARTLAHEVHHMLDPSWECGSVDALGRVGRFNTDGSWSV